jgi:hypothetical protein
VILSSRALRRGRIARGLLYLAAGGATLIPAIAVDAQTDEIQVYDAEINNPGVFSLQLHNNYTPVGREQPDFKGRHRAEPHLERCPEWALGITDWLELGAYAPVYSWTRRALSARRGQIARRIRRATRPATKLLLWGRFRARLQRSGLERTCTSGEIRPIMGWRLGSVDLILDTSFQGLGSFAFAPASRLAYNFSETWAATLEHYADYGRLNNLEPLGRQTQLLFAVATIRAPRSASNLGSATASRRLPTLWCSS